MQVKLYNGHLITFLNHWEHVLGAMRLQPPGISRPIARIPFVVKPSSTTVLTRVAPKLQLFGLGGGGGETH